MRALILDARYWILIHYAASRIRPNYQLGSGCRSIQYLFFNLLRVSTVFVGFNLKITGTYSFKFYIYCILLLRCFSLTLYKTPPNEKKTYHSCPRASEDLSPLLQTIVQYSSPGKIGPFDFYFRIITGCDHFCQKKVSCPY